MALGICCHWLDERTLPRSGRTEFYNAMDERTLQLGRYRTGKYMSDQISGTYEHNVSALIEMLPRIVRAGRSAARAPVRGSGAPADGAEARPNNTRWPPLPRRSLL